MLKTLFEPLLVGLFRLLEPRAAQMQSLGGELPRSRDEPTEACQTTVMSRLRHKYRER